MAKRTRGTGRPGQRRRIVRPAGRPTASNPSGSGLASSVPAPDATARPVARPPGSLTPEEEARAAEIEAQILAEERAAEESQRRVRDRVRTGDVVAARGRESGPLHVKAAAEYAYVRRDIVRILRMAAVLFAIIAVLWVLNTAGVIAV